VISVLLPYRDAAATLAEAASSILADMGPDDELVAIDDGSRDASTALVPRDRRVVHVTAGGVGIARALALGLDAARGELIARMDADDISLAGRLAAERALLDGDASLGAVGCRIELFGHESDGMSRYVAWQNALVTPEEHAANMFVESPLCHPSTLIRRAALDAAGGFRDPPWPEDWDLWLRLHRAGFGLAKVPTVLLRWRRTPDALTARDPRCAPERLVLARATYLADALGERAFAVWGAGDTGKRLARALEPHGKRPEFFLDIDPKKSVARGARVLGAEDGMARAHRDGLVVLVAVGAPGARDTVRARLARACVPYLSAA
jgi:glycosyltransferase involved in cell wall biosynthesis